MKSIIIALLLLAAGTALNEYADYKEVKRMSNCFVNPDTKSQSELFTCLEDRSLLYKIIPERPRVYLCLVPGELNAPIRLCNLLGITPE